MSTTADEIHVSAALRGRGEEAEAAITHGVGAVLAAFGGTYLVSEAVKLGDAWCCLGCAFYSVSLVGVLGSSTLSHLHLPERLNRRFRALDQGFIYLLAAGSLSPFALTFLRSPFWLGFYCVSVLLAAVGFVSKVCFTHRVDRISLWFYLLVGWWQGIALFPLSRVLPVSGIGWILAGFAFYCIGLVFLIVDNRRLRFHTIWHLLVLAACGCHYFAILRYVVLQNPS